MASDVFICNLALSNIGKDNISDMNEASAEARACRQFYDHVRDNLIASFAWRFARRVVPMAEVINDRAKRWQFAYRKPADCLKISFVTDEMMDDYLPSDGRAVIGGGFAYDVEGSTIYCNVPAAYLAYVGRVTDSTKFPQLFVEALSWALDVRIVMPLTRDTTMRRDAAILARDTAAVAMAADANEVRNTSDAPAEAIEARG